jgi:uncharacterized protein (TIGR02217 family)
MAFYESPRFPENIALGAAGGPVFSTSVVVTTSGTEWRDGLWQYPLHRWDVSQGIKRQADFEIVRAFFLSMAGRLHGWRFKDFADHRAAHSGIEAGVVVGLTSTTFQLVKRYTSGSQSMTRKILKPIAAGFELKNSGTTLASPADYTLDMATGIVTTAAPRTAANLTWSGTFDVPVRFDVDRLEARHVGRNPTGGMLHEWSGIPIVELRKP